MNNVPSTIRLYQSSELVGHILFDQDPTYPLSKVRVHLRGTDSADENILKLQNFGELEYKVRSDLLTFHKDTNLIFEVLLKQKKLIFDTYTFDIKIRDRTD